MELIPNIYLMIGFILGMERLSRVTKEDDSSMVCFGIINIIIFWPVYLLYLITEQND